MKINFLLVDDDYKIINSITDGLEKKDLLQETLLAFDAESAKRQAKKADFILLNPMIPDLDGITYLHDLLLADLHPGVIIMSPFLSSEMLRELNELSIAHCMQKPINLNVLLQRIETWCKGPGTRLGEQKMLEQRMITSILQELGMAPLSGYYDCRAAIEWLCYHRQSRGRITKELYPAIAHLTGSSVNQVERNIRYSIEQTWLNGNPEVQERYFGYSVSPNRSRPTNAAFLRTLADYLLQSGMIPDPNGNEENDSKGAM